MNYEINQSVCSSRGSEIVCKFLHEGDLKNEIEGMINQGQIWGVYYNENGNVVAEDIWGEIHEDILN